MNNLLKNEKRNASVYRAFLPIQKICSSLGTNIIHKRIESYTCVGLAFVASVIGNSEYFGNVPGKRIKTSEDIKDKLYYLDGPQ